MAVRDMMGGAARISAAFWSEVADAVQAPPPSHDGRAEQAPAEPLSTTEARAETPAEEPVDAPEADAAPAEESSGVLVPIDTWTRVLDQLGNLHQAGQQLAEARERAARAETQVEFLRQQLAEAKKPRPAPRPRPTGAPTPAAAPAVARPQVIDVRSTRARVIQARNRVSSWISVG